MLCTYLLRKGERRRYIGNFELSVMILAGFDGNQLPIQFVKQRQLELDSIREIHDTVRARHQAKCCQCQDTKQWNNLRRRIANGEFADDEQEKRAYDECLDNHARELVQKQKTAIGNAREGSTLPFA